MKTVLGIDCSTQSSTVVERNLDTGETISVSKSPHPVTHPPNSEQHPKSWWSAFKENLKDIDRSRVTAMSVAGQGHGLVVLDSENQIIRPAKLWNDTTSTKQSEELINSIGVEKLVKKYGSVPLAAFTITKLAWLRENEPENFNKIAKVMLPHDYFNFKFTNVATTDRSDATGTGYFDINTDAWDLDGLNRIDKKENWASFLPKVLKPDEIAGRITQKIAKELELNEDVIIGSGSNDNQASALAYGVINPGDLMISLGTSGTAFSPSLKSVVDESGIISCMAHTVSGFLPLICTLNATKVTDLTAALLGVSVTDLSSMALEGSSKSDRPVMRPWIDGERTPNRPNSRALLANIDNQITRNDLARAAFEGVIFGILNGVNKLKSFGIQTNRIIVTGGGSKSNAYLQFLADALDMPIYTAPFEDAAGSGAAVQAAAAVLNLSLRDLVPEWMPKLQQSAEPRKNQNMNHVMERFSELLEIS